MDIYDFKSHLVSANENDEVFVKINGESYPVAEVQIEDGDPGAVYIKVD